jgi:integrase
MRTERLAAGIAPNSVNREHAYLRSVFNELRRLGQWKNPNPLAELRQFKVQERELSYLTTDQIRDLLEKLAEGKNRHAAMIAKVCLASGDHSRRGSAHRKHTDDALRCHELRKGRAKKTRIRWAGNPRSRRVDARLNTQHNVATPQLGPARKPDRKPRPPTWPAGVSLSGMHGGACERET